MLNEKRQSNGIRHDLRYLVPYFYNLKKCEKTHGGVLLLVKLRACYQFAQSVSLKRNWKTKKSILLLNRSCFA